MNNELKQLAKEYFEQDNYGTRYPIYFVIRDVEYIPSLYFEEGDRFQMVWDVEATHSSDTIEGLFKELVKDKHKYDFKGLDNIDFEYEVDEYDCEAFARENELCYGIFAEKQTWKSKNMFLFKDEAEQHLKSNAHHYSKQAHVYCKHAWRVPKTEKLLMLLKEPQGEK